MAASNQATILQHRQSGEPTWAWRDRQNEAVLNGDRIGYEAWLLPPAAVGTGEALRHRASAALGPILLVASIGSLFSLIF